MSLCMHSQRLYVGRRLGFVFMGYSVEYWYYIDNKLLFINIVKKHGQVLGEH